MLPPSMFGFSLGETILIALIALVAIGPKQLPEVARSLGRMLNELKRASGDFGRTIIDPDEITRFRPAPPPSVAPQPELPIKTVSSTPNEEKSPSRHEES